MTWTLLMLACADPARTATQELIGDVPLTVTDCSKGPPASCVFDGDDDAIDAFLGAHHAQQVAKAPAAADPCMHRYRFGAEVSGPTPAYRLAEPDVAAIYRIRGSLCVVWREGGH